MDGLEFIWMEKSSRTQRYFFNFNYNLVYISCKDKVILLCDWFYNRWGHRFIWWGDM